ncbi:MAG: hypothetical protein AAFR31_10320 [Cyanobacteria bacterium J06627_8]
MKSLLTATLSVGFVLTGAVTAHAEDISSTEALGGESLMLAQSLNAESSEANIPIVELPAVDLNEVAESFTLTNDGEPTLINLENRPEASNNIGIVF